MPVGRPLVVDASVWFNLLATRQLDAVLTAASCECLAPEPVVQEVKRDPVSGAHFTRSSHPLRVSSLISVVDLTVDEVDLFLSLVSAPAAESLGDGEAAVIAVAKLRGGAAAIDDGKARRVLRTRFPDVEVIMSADLLRLPQVLEHLGPDVARDAFDDAVRYARMHVPRVPRQR